MKGRRTCFSHEDQLIWRRNDVENERRRLEAERRRLLG